MAEKKLFAAIEEIEAQIQATHGKRQKRQEELLIEYLRAREPLLQRRYELVSGQSEPTEEELQGFKPQGAAAAAGGKASSGRGVPFFWLNALCNQELLAPLITPRDRCALEYLEDVRFVRGPAGMLVEFHFANNPYFTNKILRKGIYVKRAAPAVDTSDGEALAAGPLAGFEDVREEATVIDWKPGRSLLVKAEPSSAKAVKSKAQQKQPQTHKQKQGKAGGGGKKGKKGKKGGEAQLPRAKRQHGKHGGPAPDLPDPDEEQDEEDDEVEEKDEAEDGADEGEPEEGEQADEGSGRRRPCPSFFRFFLSLSAPKEARHKELDPTVDEEEEEEDQQEEEEEEGGDEAAARLSARRALHGDVLDVLVKKVVPRAVHLYLAGGKNSKASVRDGGDEEEEGYQLVSGSPAGDVASLALTAQKALHALVRLQQQVDDLSAGLKRAEWECLVDQAREVERLAAQRRTLLVGPAGATSKLSIPAFWLRALRSTNVGASTIQHRDERALAALADVRMVWDLSRMPTPEDPTRCADLEFEFLPNPYFTNTVLRKRITFNAPGGSFNRLSVQSSQADPIDWQPDRDLTVKSAPRGAGSAAGARPGRTRQVPSFFAFFSNSPGALCRAFDIAGQSRAAQAEALQAQEEFLGEIINAVVQFGGRLAAASKVDVSDLGDEKADDEEEDEDEEEEDEQEEEEEEEEEEAAARRAARRAAARAGRRRGGTTTEEGSSGGIYGMLLALLTGAGGGGAKRGGVVMMVFIAIMLVAQILLFLDTLEFVRSRVKF